ncbi:MAG TPA: FtsX-like permease family protein [Dehalococcoidia bacterium]|nr:FtsX-like permease family protein [Dehalococcoidia bacterium]
MMRAVWRKALRDIRSRRLQTLLLVAVVAAAAATLSLALNVRASAARPADRLREASNGADAWIAVLQARSDPAAALRATPGVVEVSEAVPISWTNYGIRNGDKKQQVALVGMGPELPAFDHPVVSGGRWLAAGGTDEIVIDRGAARRLGLRAGQRIDLLTPAGPQPFTIAGFAAPTGRAPAPINDPAFAFVLPETLRRLEPEAVFGSSPDHVLRYGVRLQDPGAYIAFFEAAGRRVGPFNGRTWADVRENIGEANDFDVVFLNVFSVFALLSAGLIIANAVGGQVLSQTRDIGILKAIGFTPGQVTMTLLIQNLALSLAGGVIGVAAGLMVAPFFLERTADVLGVPASAAFDPVVLAVTLAAVCLIVTLFTLLPAWRAGRVSAIAALTGGNDAREARPSRLARAAARLGLPRVAVAGVKDLSRRPLRAVMMAGAIALAVVTTTFSLGIEATFDATMSDLTVIGGPPADVAADRDTFNDAEARRILSSHPDVQSYLVAYNYGGVAANDGFDLRGYEGDLNNPRWAIREGRMPAAAGEAAASTRLADRYRLKVGDQFEFHAATAQGPVRTTVRIVGTLVFAEGASLFVTRETLPPQFEPTDYLIRTKPGTDDARFARDLIDASGGYLDPEVLDETLADIRNQFRSVLIGLNGVLFGIAGLNLLSSMLLGIRERRRDFAILKTIGFTPGQVAASVLCGSVALACAALVVGLPLGLLATSVIFDLLSSAAGIGASVGRMPGALWLAPLVPGAIILAGLGTAIPARQAAGVQVAETLRYE